MSAVYLPTCEKACYTICTVCMVFWSVDVPAVKLISF